MPKFRKKPIIIEAEQFLPEKGQWPIGVRNRPESLCGCVALLGGESTPHVHTAHQAQRVDVVSGDWIVPEPDGEHYYPVKPSIFENTYEPVEEP